MLFDLKPSTPPQFVPFHVAPTSCAQLFPSGSPQAGSLLSADHSVQATTDTNLVALLNAQPSLNCNWTNSTSGLHVEVSVALINASLISPLNTYLGTSFIGAGVGAGILSWDSETSPVDERHDVSTNDFWVVLRSNDGHADNYDETVVESVWGLNGLSAASFE